MNHPRKDALDLEIDEVLAAMAAEEPRRVNAASVRRAMGGRRATSLPAWFAAAAILIVAIGVAAIGRAPAEKAPEGVARSGAVPMAPAPHATSSIEAEPAVQPNETRLARRPVPRPGRATEPPYEGLPRLVVAAIDIPEPLSTSLLSGDSIAIPQIEISPLVVSSLPNDHEPKQ